MVGKLLCVGDALDEGSSLSMARGFEVRAVPTAAACLSALDEDRFDLVLIASTLPDDSGCALRDRLQARSDLASTTILVVIFELPWARSTKVIGTSRIGSPCRSMRQASSIWKT